MRYRGPSPFLQQDAGCIRGVTTLACLKMHLYLTKSIIKCLKFSCWPILLVLDRNPHLVHWRINSNVIMLTAWELWRLMNHTSHIELTGCDGHRFPPSFQGRTLIVRGKGLSKHARLAVAEKPGWGSRSTESARLPLFAIPHLVTRRS